MLKPITGPFRAVPRMARRATGTLLVTSVLALSACGDDGAEEGGDDGSNSTGSAAVQSLADQPVESFMHIHGLAVPAWEGSSDDEEGGGGDVWLSTHTGLIRIGEDGDWRYASDEPHDFMGFAVNPDGAGKLYTSGHPASGSGLQNPLGLMVSDDFGRSWEVRSLQGEVDFHALAVSPGDGDSLYGWDATGQRLLTSDDGGEEWTELSPPEPDVWVLAVDPSRPDTVVAGTPRALYRSEDAGDSWDQLWSGGPVWAVAYDPADEQRMLAYVELADGTGERAESAGAGQLRQSVDGGATWEPYGDGVLGETVGEDKVTYLAVHPEDPDVVYAGTLEASVYRTSDGGMTWERLAAQGVPAGPEGPAEGSGEGSEQ